MSTTVEVDVGRNLVHVTLHGPCGVADLAAVIAQLRADEQADAMSRFLWDIRTARIAIRGDEVRSLIETSVPHAARRSGQRAAIVTSSAAMYGIGRMAETYADIFALVTTLRVFRAMDEALEWLGVAPAEDA